LFNNPDAANALSLIISADNLFDGPLASSLFSGSNSLSDDEV
jgi:hypothetical protein